MPSGLDSIAKFLMLTGCVLLVVGGVLYVGGKWLPLGKLPGDFRWESGNMGFYFPLMTSVILSLVLTVLLNLFNRR